MTNSDKTRSNLARTIITINASFSLITGIAMSLFPSSFTALIFANPAPWQYWVLLITGLGLIPFAIFLLYTARNPQITRFEVLLVVDADIAWVLGSFLVLYLFPDQFSRTGEWVIILAALIVAGFAIGQFIGSRLIQPSHNETGIRLTDGKITASVSRTVHAPVETVWHIMVDHPGYADVASNISKVEVLSGSELGMVRRCYGPKGENWTETCDHYEPNQSYGFNIHTDAPGYPYPFSSVRGLWAVEPSENGARFSIEIEVESKGNRFGRWLMYIMARNNFRNILSDLADGWAEKMEQNSSPVIKGDRELISQPQSG